MREKRFDGAKAMTVRFYGNTATSHATALITYQRDMDLCGNCVLIPSAVPLKENCLGNG